MPGREGSRSPMSRLPDESLAANRTTSPPFRVATGPRSLVTDSTSAGIPDQVLAIGSTPLGALRRSIDEWVELESATDCGSRVSTPRGAQRQ